MVPPCASSNCPGFAPAAPVKAPFSYPNSSLSSNWAGSAPQLRLTKGPSRRELARWMARAANSLPVPLSPWTSTAAWESPTTARKARSSSMGRERPMSSPAPASPSRSRRVRFSSSSERFSSALRTSARHCSRSAGLVRK